MTRVVMLLALLIGVNAYAVEPNEMMTDPTLEARARQVSQALRCVVCQNETIDESNAELARDMRLVVRRRIAAGDTNDQVLQYMVGRYGDFVLLKPRFMNKTWVLWFGPALMLILGGTAFYRTLRRAQIPPAPLSTEEETALAQLTPEQESRS